MDGRISVETAGDVTLVTKRVSGGDARRRLAHEAAVLADLTHPGVVRFVSFDEDIDHAVLVTESGGAASLADHRPSTAEAVAGLGAAVAGIVADLHDAGLAHGGLQADHVLLGASRHPVLCSFGNATRDLEARRTDVVALADLITDLLAAALRAGHRSDRQAVRALEAAATQARQHEVDARQLAGLLAAVPGAALPAEPGRPPVAVDTPATGTRTWRLRPAALPKPEISVGRRQKWLAAAAVVAVVAAVTAVSLRGTGTEAPARPAAAPSSSSDAAPAVVASAPTPTAETSTPLPDLGACAPGPDVDGDGCGDDTEVVGRLIRVDDTWYTAGRSGDVVALDHWRCADTATPAVLRPSTGEVFVFDHWPAPDEPLVVRVDHRVDAGATTLVSGLADGCPVPMAGGPS